MLLAMVSLNRNGSCGTTLIASRRVRSGMTRTSWPSTRTRPLLGSIERVSSCPSTVLPLPVGPVMPRKVPAGTCRFTPFRTGLSP